MLWMEALFVLNGYLLGSVLFSYHVPLWLAHINIVEQSEDHNPGTANAFRYAGVPIGILCLVLDLAKGAFPVWYSLRVLGPRFLLLPLVMAAPVFGHATTPWYGFKGGKAIAATFGVLIGLMPINPSVYVLVFWYLFFSLVWVIHPNERRTVFTFIAFAVTSAALAFLTHRFDIAAGCSLCALPPLYKNYVDISRAQKAREAAANQPLPEQLSDPPSS